MLHTRNVTTGKGPALLPGRGAISPTTRRAPTRLSRRADQVGMPRLPIFEPFGLSSRSCCSTGRLMRSWFIDGNLADLRLSFFPPRSLPERAMASVRPGWGGPGQRGRSTTNGPRPRDPGRKFANKIYLQRDSWRVVFPSCKNIQKIYCILYLTLKVSCHMTGHGKWPAI